MAMQRFWTPGKDALLGTNTDKAIAEIVSTTEDGARARRVKLGIAPFGFKGKRKWSKRELNLLGKLSDRELAAKIGVARLTVSRKRKELGIGPANPEKAPGKPAR